MLGMFGVFCWLVLVGLLLCVFGVVLLLLVLLLLLLFVEWGWVEVWVLDVG